MTSTSIVNNIPPSSLPKPSKAGVLGYGMFGLGVVTGTATRISNGEGLVSSVVKAGATSLVEDTIVGMFLGPYGSILKFAGDLGVIGGQVLLENGKNNANSIAGVYSTAKHNKVVNTQAAQTMRQRGMAMINQNGEATRSVLGSEARSYFRSAMTRY